MAGSSGSTPTNAPSRMAASVTVRAMGPAVSCVLEMGMMPLRLTSPTVGFTPTMPQQEEGAMMDPSVSVPTATAQRLADTEAPDPELEPEGFRFNT